jgi:hypothetical protein
MLDFDWKPDAKKLRQFSAIWLAGFGLMGAAAAWKTGAWTGTTPLVLWAIAAGIGFLGLAAPKAVRPVYLAWTAAGLVIGTVISYLLLAVIYFGLFTPLALVFRLMGRDALRRRWDARAQTYWMPYDRPKSPSRYFDQF